VETLVRILVISNDDKFVKRIKDLTSHPQVIVRHETSVPDDPIYHFYILGSPGCILTAIDKIREIDEGCPIYLAGAVCEEKIPVRKLIRCHIADCLETEVGLKSFMKRVRTFRQQQIKIREASTKLDCLKAGDLQALASQMKRTESERFVDYIQNHPLPMVLVSREGEVLHANVAMETMIGSKLPGMPASHFWMNPDEYDEMSFELKEEGQLLGREVALKNIDGNVVRLKLYTSLHCDSSGEWLNTRCLFVPSDERYSNATNMS